MRDDVFLTALAIDWDGVPERDAYPFSVPAIASIDVLDLARPLTFFCGENGTGKSTLLEALSVAFGLNAEGGSRNHLYTVHDTHSELCEHLRLMRGLRRPRDSFFVRSDTLFNLISAMDELEDDRRYFEGRSLHARSHGEGMLALVSRRFGGEGLYVLDEPETGLSQLGQIVLLAEIMRLANAGAQFVIATHSPILMTAANAVVYEFSDEVREMEPEQTLEWTMLQRFLENPEKTLVDVMGA